MLNVSWRKFLLISAILYVLFSSYTVITILFQHSHEKKNGYSQKKVQSVEDVEIWGKAAISLFLWEHILDGVLNSINGHMLRYGELSLNNLRFKFQTGPLVTVDTVSKDVTNLILILNGRSKEKIVFAKTWLQSLHRFNKLKTVVLVLLGDEKCNNQWITPFLSQHGGKVDAAFIVYDIANVDERTIFQWPLGVATYRGFENTDYNLINAPKRRKYICNFLGTIYKGSSRQSLLHILREQKLASVCYTKPRPKWTATENTRSRETYLSVIENSDLTLCPVGINSESYRMYEAMSLGSVPVIEDVMTPGNCSRNAGKGNDVGVLAPFRLLKEASAPVLFIKDWTQLRELIETEKRMSLSKKVKRRLEVIRWYKRFKYSMKNKLVHVLHRILREKNKKLSQS